MTIEERIERVLVAKVPIYRKDIPEKGIVKDCGTSLSIKNSARNALRVTLARDNSLIERYEQELCLQ